MERAITSPTADSPTAPDVALTSIAEPAEAERAAAYLEPPRSIRRTVSDAWRNRRLLPALGFNAISRRYQKTYLGRAWVVIRPAMDAAGGALLFGGVLSVSSGDGTPYLLFLTGGLLGWRLFDRTVVFVTRSPDRFRRITRKLDVPLLLIPIGGCGPALVDAAVYLAIFLLVALGYLLADGQLWLAIGPETLAAVAGILLCWAFGLAIGLFTSVINSHTRDIRHVIRYVLQIWMFATPVLYPITQLPENLRPLAQANPLTGAIDLVKHGLLNAGTLQLLPVVWSCVATCLIMAAGLWFFSRRASGFTRPAGGDDEDDEDEVL